YWRPGQKTVALRIFISKDKKYFAVPAKIQPTLKRLNNYVKSKGYKTEEDAEADSEVKDMMQRLFIELRDEHGLKELVAREKHDLRTKEFDFTVSLGKFEVYKS